MAKKILVRASTRTTTVKKTGLPKFSIFKAYKRAAPTKKKK